MDTILHVVEESVSQFYRLSYKQVQKTIYSAVLEILPYSKYSYKFVDLRT
jgi:hypothetical protein